MTISECAPITALKIEQANDMSQLDDNDPNTETGTHMTISDSAQYYSDQIEEEIILIGEKTDIRKLLSNTNNQLANFFVQNFDENYKTIAKDYVNDIIDGAISKIKCENEIPTRTADENIIDYYKNLEKHLSIVRHEIDKLKTDAYMDLEYISQALNESSIESDANYKTQLSNSYLSLLEQNTNYEEVHEPDIHSDHTDAEYSNEVCLEQSDGNQVDVLDDLNHQDHTVLCF
jgi:hypothetical protein